MMQGISPNVNALTPLLLGLYSLDYGRLQYRAKTVEADVKHFTSYTNV